MDNRENTFGTSKKTLAMQLYGLLIEEDAADLQEYGAERFLEQFQKVFQDYNLCLKSTMIE